MQKAHAPDSPSSDATDVHGFPLVDDRGMVVTQDRRKSERRRWGARPSYPLVDSVGDVVTHNRRRVVERRTEQASNGGAPRATEEPGPALVLRFGGEVWELASDGKGFSMGRRDECDLRIGNRFVSREHARIDARDNEFILTDTSSNGTFVRLEEGEVHEVFHNIFKLTGSGLLRLGRPVEGGAEDLIRFRVKT